jgi:hypothetical protein
MRKCVLPILVFLRLPVSMTSLHREIVRHDMERITLLEEFDINAVRFKEAKTLIDRELYIHVIDNILDEWNRGKTVDIEPIVGLGSE